MARWGSAVLDRLPLAGDETVLDAGCGSGRVTEELLERLPEGWVIAADAAPSMLVEARRRLARFGDRVTYLECDLARPLPIVGPVDAVLSTATFHWVLDHDALFANLAAVLRPGGRLVAQCGGVGNVAAVHRAAAEVLDDGWEGPWNFATPEETAVRLEAAGFVDVETWLHEEPTPIEPGEPMETFLTTVILRNHLQRVPEPERAGFVRRVAERIPGSTIDYVRLNILATFGGQPG
ncbi:MAG TPA: methyltransferase domain-containing protein, partial [Acidimicrobiales bacterium]|nr:methyltransferase domain-containing protein [Acidimicrobiales bacterium]